MLYRMLAAGLVLGGLSLCLLSAEPEASGVRKQAAKLQQDGNWNDALTLYRDLLQREAADGSALVASDLKAAVQSLRQLGRHSEIDALREAAIERHAGNWQLLEAAAETLMNGTHYGFEIAGEFRRGNHRGGGKYVSSFERDRVRALQLMQQARPLVQQELQGKKPQTKEVGQFYFQFADYLLRGQNGHDAWQLQVLTDLTTLPDYTEAQRYYGRFGGRSPQGAPVDADGNPVLHHLPASWEEAKTDGERWRWMLHRAAEADPSLNNRVLLTRADFLLGQFGVQTMQQWGALFLASPEKAGEANDGADKPAGPFAVHSLSDEETIARLATGAKRFTLAEEFNFIHLYRTVAESGRNSESERAYGQLAQIYQNRRQFPRAAEVLKKAIDIYGAGSNQYRQHQLEQIIANWGQFEPVSTQPAGEGATVDFRYRNGGQVSFTARPVDIELLLKDLKTYLNSKPKQLDWQQLNIGQIGYRIVHQDQKKYLGKQVAEWSLDLDPAAGHLDRRVTVQTPLQKAGAYFVTAKMKDGNTSHIVLWVADTAIATKRVENGAWYYVADARTGEPIEKANVEFFGWQQKYLGNRQYQITTKNFAEFSDATGQVTPEKRATPNGYQWIVIARKEGRMAFHGFGSVWHGTTREQTFQQLKVYTVTDRPVYRPEHKVQFRLWIRQAKYDLDNVSLFANREFTVRIMNPRNEKAFEEKFTTDEFGGIDGEYTLPEEAVPGSWSLQVVPQQMKVDGIPGQVNVGGGVNFRVEEYKKPEFEVLVEAPEESVQLGEKFSATIRAKYYFGAPVTQATVNYRVTRTTRGEPWFPRRPWDWFYGPGYWWFGKSNDWYPGWQQWGCLPPHPPWWGNRHNPPEVLLENEVAIGPDGTVQVEIDTEIAAKLHGDEDHDYEITAEVTDDSRRTITGTGNIIVSREPFRVVTWVDRGFYRSGDTVQARMQAMTLDGKPVTGDGNLVLYHISYDEQNTPVETEVASWQLAPGADGQATQQFQVPRAGQYRVVYRLKDAKDRQVEGGILFTVHGADAAGADYRFNELELTVEQAEYQPGDTAKVMISSNHPDATVLLFVRPINGVAPRPVVFHLKGRTVVHELEITRADMPNFFLEAVTIFDGQLHQAVEEVIVPPAGKILNVEVQASKEEYLPGEEATVQVKLTDSDGKPVTASTVLTVYDRAIEYISGGSNAAEIREFFWKWRRTHYPSTSSSLQRSEGNLVPKNTRGMGNLGVFGHLIFGEAEEKAANSDKRVRKDRAELQMNRRGGGNAMAMPMMAKGAEMADAVAAAPPGPPGGQPAAEPVVRKNFADTAFWSASVKPDDKGMAEVTFPMPESLTSWKLRAWSVGHGTRVGQAESEVVTTKHLLVRLQAPRFFTEKDEVVLSAIVHNEFKVEKQVRVVLELEGDTLSPPESLTAELTIPAGTQQRVDWRVKAVKPGTAIIRMKALAAGESDAVQMSFPVQVHGMLRTESYTGVIRPGQETSQFEFTVPADRKPEQSKLEVRWSPSLAGALVDALPYLVTSPQQNTEATLNRFLPAVITQNILKKLGVDLKSIQKKRTNLNAGELGDPQERAKRWKQFDENPVFSEEKVERLVKQGLRQLTSMQLSDGGWGWFSGYGERSSAHMTALAMHGLQLAAENELAIVPGVRERGTAWLKNYQEQQITALENAEHTKKKLPRKPHADDTDALVYFVLVEGGTASDKMERYLYRDRTHLSVYAKSLFGLALEQQEHGEKLAMILRNIEQFLQQDDVNETAWLQLPEGSPWWRWYGNEVEANAMYLKLLARTEPKSERASRLVKYLLNNRSHATWWNSTRDTAFAVEAMAEYLKHSGELQPEMTVEVLYDGQKQKEVHITRENFFSFDSTLVLEGEQLQTGTHQVQLRRKGNGPLYWSGWQTNFTQEDPIPPAGLEIAVQRKYYRLHRIDSEENVAGSRGQAISQQVLKYRREELPNFASVKSGDLLEIELEIDSRNDYEYLMFEDLKAAGTEPVTVQSGYNGNSLGAYMELRDERVSFFVKWLARGKHSVSYRVRAEIPGQFSALPTKASAVYAPELKANSSEFKLIITD